jgi:MFS family permease
MKNFYNDNKEIIIIFTISLLYALIFSGYTLSNQYLLLLYPDIGIYLSSLLFAAMFICTIFAPYISHYILSIKWTVILGTFGTTVWLLSFNIDFPYLIIISTILAGFGSGLYRSHQFILIKKLYPNNVSRNMAVSLSVFNMYGVITAPIIFTMLFLDISIYNVLKCFTVVVLISQIFLMFVKNVENEKKELNYFGIFKTKIWLLLPLSQVQAANFTTYFVFIPKNINEHFDSSIYYIATLALVFSLVNPFSTYLVGIWFNRTESNRWVYFFVSIIFSVIIYFLLIYMFDFHVSLKLYDYILICVLGVIWAIYDSILYTINMIVMAQLFDENVFCVQRIFYCSNMMLFVVLVKILPSYVFLGLLVVLNVLSLIGYVSLTSNCNKYDNVPEDKADYEEIV